MADGEWWEGGIGITDCCAEVPLQVSVTIFSYGHFSCNSSWDHSRKIDVNNIYLSFLRLNKEMRWAVQYSWNTILVRVGKWFCRKLKPPQTFSCRAWSLALEEGSWAVFSGGFPGTCGTAGGACPTCSCGAPTAGTSRCVGAREFPVLSCLPSCKTLHLSAHTIVISCGGESEPQLGCPAPGARGDYLRLQQLCWSFSGRGEQQDQRWLRSV